MVRVRVRVRVRVADAYHILDELWLSEGIGAESWG